ncbi:MAG: hypothetical protein HY855_09420 [Burkholderiales bacterium]|nr:hypothetical protein [Burkholderiales bacterium]
MNARTTPITLGKYLVSPLARLTDEGHYAPSVSIRTGRGSATHDRVLRFHRHFGTAREALHYATVQGREWVANPAQR